jgi:hypothetical protein
LGFGGPQSGIGPFIDQGAVEAFGFAVGGGVVGLGAVHPLEPVDAMTHQNPWIVDAGTSTMPARRVGPSIRDCRNATIRHSIAAGV